MKRGNCMKYYHLTNETEVDSILKNGLKPLIGENSESVGETEERVYLTDYDSVKYWARLLNRNVLLEVEMDKEIQFSYQYGDAVSTYNEFYVYSSIEPSRIRQIKMPELPDDEVNVSILLGYSYTLTSLCNEIISYYVDKNTVCTMFNDEDELIEEVTHVINAMKYITKPKSSKTINELRNKIRSYHTKLCISWDTMHIDNPDYPDICGLGLRRCDIISVIEPDKKSISVRKQLTKLIRTLYEDCFDIECLDILLIA